MISLKRLFGGGRQSLADSGLLGGLVDYHSHLLPGVDDGIRTQAEALEVLKVYGEAGVRAVWLTPHIMEDYPNRTQQLRERFAELGAAYATLKPERPVELHLAAENMLDALFLERLEAGDLLPVIDGEHLLVETSCYNPPFGFGQLLKEIRVRGYTPVLAHPERYHYLTLGDCESLCRSGVVLQLNMASVTGAYGSEACKKACALLRKGYYALAGSDLHQLHAFEKWIRQPVEKPVLQAIRHLLQVK